MSTPQPIGSDGRSRGPGRPRRASQPATKRIEFVVTEEEQEALKQVASREGKPIATVIREAVNERVADEGEPNIFR